MLTHHQMFALSKFTLLSGLHAWSQNPCLYGKTMNLYRERQHDYNTALASVDVPITPTTPYVADRHPPANAGPVKQMAKSNGVAMNTMCFNASGHPAISIPIGFLPPLDNIGREEGIKLPVGLQIVGGMFLEEVVYRAAAAWESNFDWKKINYR
jgi:amidase